MHRYYRHARRIQGTHPGIPGPSSPSETFAPIELDPKVQQTLTSIPSDGDLDGRMYRIDGFEKWSPAKKIAWLRKYTEDVARDPKLAEKTVAILRSANVPVRAYEQQWAALLQWVQREIYYVNEPNERFQSPQYTLTTKMGDCLPASTLLLGQAGLIALEDVKPGTLIWGYDKWTRVEALVDKGLLSVSELRLDTGRAFRATPGHKLYVRAQDDFLRVKVEDLQEDAELLVPEAPGGQVRAAPLLGTLVSHVRPNVAVVRCFDLQTEDHYVYLPEADVVVSNCDDLAILLGALGHSIRLPFRFVISGRNKDGERVRWIEGEGSVPPGCQWVHIYLHVGWPAFHPRRWKFAEPTLQVPLGWDAMERGPGGKNLLPELSDALGDAGEWVETGIGHVKSIPWANIVGLVIASVTSAGLIRAWDARKGKGKRKR